ncbi:MAG: DUF11 domain-containing protein [Chloroflexi bacterium]|nr:DUF11 domain-containing protein [Chloroflexota bacterium]
MKRKIVPWSSTLLIVLALLISQVQVVLALDHQPHAGDVQDDINGPADGQDDPRAETTPDAPLRPALPDDDRFPCKLAVNGFLLAAPFTGPPDPEQPNYGATVEDTETTPTPEVVSRQVGDPMSWLVVVGNSTGGDPECNNPERLHMVEAQLVFGDTSGSGLAVIDVPLQFPTSDPEKVLLDGELAWAVVEYDVPAAVNGDLTIRVKAAAEAENDKDDIGVDPNDTVDFDDDQVEILGPGFEVVSFDPSVASAAPNQNVDFTLVIENVRPGNTITDITVTSSVPGFQTACADFENWLDMTGTPLVFGTGNLPPGEQAQCEIFDIPIPSNPAPETYSLTGQLRVSDGSIEVSRQVTSTPVEVELPDVSISKNVTEIKRGPNVVSPPAEPGDVITYAIIVRNTGEIQLEDLWIVDSLTGVVPVPFGTTLDPGQEFAATTTYTVIPSNPDPLVNTVEVTAKGVGTGGAAVDAVAATSVDLADSSLKVTLTAVNPGTGDPVDIATPPQTVEYRLLLENESSDTIISDLEYVITPVGSAPDLSTVTLLPNGERTLTWQYDITGADPDPLSSVARVRGVSGTNRVLYGQDDHIIDIASPDIGISVIVTEPDRPTVLRGGNVVYEITVENKTPAPICNVVVNQYRRDLLTDTDVPVMMAIPMNWPTATPGRLEATGSGDETATTSVTYLVTGSDPDPLHMIFEVIADDSCPGDDLGALSDSTVRTLDISNAQVNAELLVDLGPDGAAMQDEELTFTFAAQNVGAVTLTNLTATYCIPHAQPVICGEEIDDLTAGSIVPFEPVSGTFNYTILARDIEESPFVVEVTMYGTDAEGKEVSIRAATRITVATEDIVVEVGGPQNAVNGDEETFTYNVYNNSGVELTNVRIYNMAQEDSGDPYGYELVGTADTFPDGGLISGNFLHTIDLPGALPGTVFTMHVRVLAEFSGQEFQGNGLADVVLIPMIGVIKTGPSTADAGQAISYDIEIKNNSHSQTLTVLSYTDTVLNQPPYNFPVITHADFGIDYDQIGTWPGQPGILPPGDTVVGRFTIASVEAVPTPLTNVFVVSGRKPDGSTVSGQAEHTIDIACPIEFDLVVTNLDDDPDDVLGEDLQWDIWFTNVSTQTINNIVIDETLNWGEPGNDPVINWPGAIGTLEPGQTATLQSFQKLITNEYYGAGEDYMGDRLTATFSEVAGSNQCQQEFRYYVYSPIFVFKWPRNDMFLAFAGDVVTYDITVENVTEDDDDPYDYYTVTVYDSLLQPSPIPLDYDGSGDPPEPFETTGIMGPGEILTTAVPRTVLPTDPEELVNVITAEFPDPADPDVTFITWFELMIFTSNPLQLTKEPSVDSATPGTTISYDYTLTNISPYDIQNVTLVDSLIGDLIPDPIPLFAPFDFILVEGVEYTIPINAPDPLVNTVTAAGRVIVPDGLDRDITNEVIAEVDLEDPEIAIVKTVQDSTTGDPLPDNLPISLPDGDGMPEADAGQTVDYCFTITNTASTDIQPGEELSYVANIQLVDPMLLPIGTEPNTLQQQFEAAIAAQLPTLPPGAVGPRGPAMLYAGEEVIFCYAPPGGPISLNAITMGDPVVNLASLTGTSSNGTEVYNEYELAVDLLGQDLMITKTPSQPLAYVGEEITYVVRIENRNLTYDIQDIVITDAFGGGSPVQIPLDQFDWSNSGVVGNPVGQLAPPTGPTEDGGYATYTYSYVIQADDPDPLENYAVAVGFLNDNVEPDQRTEVLDSTRTAVAVTSSQLLVRKSAQPLTANPGDTVSYTISILNIGSRRVSNIRGTDVNPANAPGGTVYDCPDPGDPATCEVSDPELDSYETGFITYEITLPDAATLLANPNWDPFVNTITVLGDVNDADGNPLPDPVEGEATVAVDIIQPGIRLSMSPAIQAASQGQTVTYNVIITNTGGTGDDLSSLELLDVDEFEVVPLTTFVYGLQPYWDDDGDPGTPDVPNPKAGTTYNGTDPLLPGEQLIGSFTVTVPDPYDGAEYTNVVQVTGESGPTLSPVIDRTSATIDIRDAGINVEKLSSITQGPVGTSVIYTVRVTNVGGIALERLVIADASMPGSTMTVEDGFPNTEGSDAGTLDPNETYETTYTYTLDAGDDDPFVNWVTVTGHTINMTTIVNVAQATVDIQTGNLIVVKQACGGPDIDGNPATINNPCAAVVDTDEEDTITYYVDISNPSALNLQNIAISDPNAPAGVFDGIVWPDEPNELGPGEAIQRLMYPYTIQPGDPDPLQNTITVVGQIPSDPPLDVEATDSASISLVSGELELTKDAPAQAALGEEVTYTLTVTHTNPSGQPITGIEVFDPMTGSSNPICGPFDLNGGESQVCSFTHTISPADGSPVVNTARAEGIQNTVPVSDVATHSINVVSGGLTVSKTADDNFVTVGTLVTFTYRIENTGDTTITSMNVSDSDTGLTVSPPWPTELDPGEIETRTVTRTMTGADPDPYINTLTVTGQVGLQDIMVEATETVNILSNDTLAVTNTPSANYVLDGADVTFTYVVSNFSDTDLTGLTLSDSFGALTIPATLLANDSVTVYRTVTADLPGPVVSTVFVEATGPTALSDSATAEVNVTTGGILVVKSADVISAQVGEDIDYTIEVTNVGDEPLQTIAVIDPMLVLGPAPPATLDPGNSFTMTGTYTVQVTDDQVVNTVTATAVGANTATDFEDTDSAIVSVVDSDTTLLALTKEVSPLSVPLNGSDADRTVTYRLRIQNIDDLEGADNITIEDPPGTPLAVTVPALAPGQAWEYTYDVIIPDTTTEPQITNTAEVFEDGTSQDTATATVTVQVLQLTVTPTPDSGYPGDTIVYNFTITNLGQSTITNFTLDFDPSDFTYILPPSSLNPGPNNFNGFYELPAFGDPIYDSPTLNTTVGVSIDGVLQDEDTAVVALQTDILTLTKTADLTTAYPGDTITYTFEITNNTSSTVTGVTITDPLLDPLPFGTLSVPAGGWGPDVATFPLPTDPGDPIFANPTLDNTATLEVSGTTVSTDTASVPLSIDIISLDKTPTSSTTVPGSTITYNFTITNHTQSPIANVNLVDPGVDSFDTVFPITVQPGDTVVQGFYDVPDPYTNPTYDNTAEVQVDGTPVATDTASVTISTAGMTATILSVQQTSGFGLPDLLQTGESATLTFELRNIGAEQITGLQATVGTTIPSLTQDFQCTPALDALPILEPAGHVNPITLEPDDFVNVTCTFVPPIGEPDYLTTNGLNRTLSVNATGQSGTETLIAEGTATVELVDLRLGVELTLSENPVQPDDAINVTLTITNEGASPIGCNTTEYPGVDPDSTCHLRALFTTDPISTDLNAVLTPLETLFEDTVLQPGESATETTVDYTVSEGEDNTDIEVMADGGYYSTLFTPGDEDNYTVFGTDSETLDVQGDDQQDLVVEILQVIPNAPVTGQSVSYAVRVTNNGTTPITGLAGQYRIVPLATTSSSSWMLTSGGPRPPQQTGWTSFSLGTEPVTLGAGLSITATIQRTEDQTGRYVLEVAVAGVNVDGQINATVDRTITPANYLTPTPSGSATITPTLDPNATEPQITKSVDVESALPGDTVTWTVEVRNGGTNPMGILSMRDEFPSTLTIVSVVQGGTQLFPEGNVYTVDTTEPLAPGESIIITVTTTVNADVVPPAQITNTFCATREGGEEVCDDATVNIGPEASELPATGSEPRAPLGFRLDGLFGVLLVGALMLLMGSQPSNRRTTLAGLFVIVALIAIGGAAVLLVTQDSDDDGDTGTPVSEVDEEAEAGEEELEPPSGAEADVADQEPDGPEEQVEVSPETSTDPSQGPDASESTPLPTPLPTTPPPPATATATPQADSDSLFVSPPSATPYIQPTPDGVRYLEIPKLPEFGQQQIQIQPLPFENGTWDISAMRWAVGWLEGTTWMEEDWGNTVLAAHLQFNFDDPGPFYNLDQLEVGDEIIVREGEYRTYTFMVTEKNTVSPDDWTVTAPTNDPTLTLITCTNWDQSYGVFSERLVVRAIRIPDPVQG